jgi:hypothetical protein
MVHLLCRHFQDEQSPFLTFQKWNISELLPFFVLSKLATIISKFLSTIVPISIVKTITPLPFHIMLDLNNDQIFYFISRNRRSMMNWRHHCHGFNSFEILYHEKLETLQHNHVTINAFLVDVITMIYCRIYALAKMKGIPFHVYRLSTTISAGMMTFCDSVIKNTVRITARFSSTIDRHCCWWWIWKWNNSMMDEEKKMVELLLVGGRMKGRLGGNIE